MSNVTPHIIRDDNLSTIGWVWPAERDAVDYVLSQSSEELGFDGRSNWVWIRLANGDLVLATYPQGDTYVSVVDDPRNQMPADIEEDMNAVRDAAAHLQQILED